MVSYFTVPNETDFNSLKIDGHKSLPIDPQITTNSLKLEDYDSFLVTMEKRIPIFPPTVRIGEASFAAKGNISVLSAPPKHFKTGVTNVITAGAISPDGRIDGFEGIEVEPNPYFKAVLNFDTEQAEDDHQYNVKTVCRRAGFITTPDHYRAYNMRRLKMEELKVFVETIAQLSFDKFGGVHLIVIDGGADFIQSVNDEAASNNIIEFFTHLAIRFSCAIIIVVHTNPSFRGEDTKERGHFGSALQRKCYGLLTITKKAEVFTISPKMLRKGSIEDSPIINFKYSREKGYPVCVDQPDEMEINAAKAIKQNEALKSLALKVFKPLTAIPYNTAIKGLMEAKGCKRTTATTLIKDLLAIEYIKQGEDKNYRINTS